MKKLLRKFGLIIISFSIIFMLGNCGGGGESEKAEGTKGTTNTESTKDNDTEKMYDSKIKSYNLEKGYYYDFFAHVQVPVITKYTEIKEKFGERTKDSEVEKKTYLALVLSIKNIKLDGNKFSGTTDMKTSDGSGLTNESLDINNENWNSWEGKKPHGTGAKFDRCSGEFSQNSKTIKYIELERLSFSHNGEKSGKYEIKKRRDFVIMKDIPVQRIYAQDIIYKVFKYKHEPTIKVYGSNHFLDDAKEILSSVTDADKIIYSGNQYLNKNRQGKVTWDVWDEKEETLIKVDEESIAKNKSGWTITFRRGKKIFDIEEAEKEVKNDNKEWLGEIKGGKIILGKTTFVANEKMLVNVEYKFRRNSVYEDINEIYVGIIPKGDHLDLLFENIFGNKKYILTKKELKKYKKDSDFISLKQFPLEAPEPYEEKGEQAEIDYYNVILYYIDSDKKIVEIDRKAIIVTKKEKKGFIKIHGNNKTFKPGDDVKVFYHESNKYLYEISGIWVGLQQQNFIPRDNRSKSDFITTKDYKKSMDTVCFKAPKEPGKYKLFLINEVIPKYITELNFEVIKN
ncbi:MAG: hypothetical protein K8R41_05925 [Bacteroidales bacterium]|nr:hypothetical protein [Bacteroidales bacterium]